MARPPALKERDIRETKADLLGRIQEQRRACGIAVPDTKTAEEFLHPILDKVVRDHGKDEVPPEQAAPAQAASQADGLPTGLGRIRGPKAMHEDGVEVTVSDHVDVTIKANGQVALPRGYRPPREARTRLWVRELLKVPEWRESIGKIMRGALSSAQREMRLFELIERSMRHFGDPRKPRERKIVVNG